MANLSVLSLATLGGLISFLSTSVGSLLSLIPTRASRWHWFHFSIEFALGLMLSAVAFSLVVPAATQSLARPGFVFFSALGFIIGGSFIYALKVRNSKSFGSSHWLLALALLLHNLPEGMASGASLAGLRIQAAVPILASISIQNIPEGLLIVLCLRALGWSPTRSLLGGFASGLVELFGGVFAGFALAAAASALPVILMVAGGAMFTSVLLEIQENGAWQKLIRRPEFALGLLSIPILNFLTAPLLK